MTRNIEYAWYLSSDEWKHRSLQTKADRGHTCEHCGANANLEVHHLTYKHIGAERPEDMLVLCRKCHARIHGIEGQRSRGTDAPCMAGAIIGDVLARRFGT
jgi:phage terminase large subunit GpA-like protein